MSTSNSRSASNYFSWRFNLLKNKIEIPPILILPQLNNLPD
ncbi:hypothetical protein [Pseudomonas sp. FEN]|nr:hypothetical protein [Pseudomonas sp. FEN]